MRLLERFFGDQVTQGIAAADVDLSRVGKILEGLDNGRSVIFIVTSVDSGVRIEAKLGEPVPGRDDLK